MGKLEYKINENGCHEVTSHYIQKDGYVRIYRNSKDIYAHRFAYEQKFGKIPKGKIMLHSCDNRCCVNPDHLSVGTYQDNTDDMVRKNRQRFGGSTITDKEVMIIYNSDLPQQVLADAYNMTQTNISLIKNGKCHNRVTKHTI